MRPFAIWWGWNLLYGIGALALSALLTWALNIALVHRIDTSLLGDFKLTQHWPFPDTERLKLAPDQKPLEGKAAVRFSPLDTRCYVDATQPWDLDTLELALRRAETSDNPAKELFQVICQSMMRMRMADSTGPDRIPLVKAAQSVATTGSDTNAAPGVTAAQAEPQAGSNANASARSATATVGQATPPQAAQTSKARAPQDSISSHIRVVALATCNDQLTNHYKGDDLSEVPDLGWYPPFCILERARSVKVRDNNDPTRIFLKQDAATSGVEGTVYVFRHPRLRTAYQNPNALSWTKEDAELNGEAKDRQRALTIVSRALNRLDKLLLPRLRTIERAYWLERFLLRSLSNGFQFLIFALGMWAALLYLHMIWQTKWGSASAAKVAQAIKRSVPLGEPPPGQWNRLPYNSEMRNAADELATFATYSGKAWADTLTEWVPTLGFIGTVVGMIGAMDAVGAVVAAEPGPELFTAMSGVTSELSLAFYTTFVALTVGLLLAWLRRHAISAELDAVANAVAQART